MDAASEDDPPAARLAGGAEDIDDALDVVRQEGRLPVRLRRRVGGEVDNGVDARTCVAAGVCISDVEVNNLVVRTRCTGKPIGAPIGQAKAVALAVRLPKRGADATGGTGEQHEAAVGRGHREETHPSGIRTRSRAPSRVDHVEPGSWKGFIAAMNPSRD